MRILALDVGTKTIGVAVSDPGGILATPVTVIRRTAGVVDVQRVAELAREYDAERILIGLPLSMSGNISEQTKFTKAFADQLGKVTATPIEMHDERLTTAEAERRMREAGLSAKKRKENIDAMAATVLLQDYLDSKGASQPVAKPVEPATSSKGRRRPTGQRY